MSFTCPRCGMTSSHPRDEEEGYCGNCHDWTRGEPLGDEAICRLGAGTGFKLDGLLARKDPPS